MHEDQIVSYATAKFESVRDSLERHNHDDRKKSKNKQKQVAPLKIKRKVDKDLFCGAVQDMSP